MAYAQLSPFGERRADLRAGIVASTIANVNGSKSEPSDFLPRFKAEDNEDVGDVQPIEQQHAQIKILKAVFGDRRDREKIRRGER